MDKGKKTIKSKNRKYLIGYLVFHFLIFAIVADFVDLLIKDKAGFLDKLQDPKSIIALIAILMSIVFEGVLSSRVKEILVFWKVKNTLPGCKAFSEIAKNDPRIDAKMLDQLVEGGP